MQIFVRRGNRFNSVGAIFGTAANQERRFANSLIFAQSTVLWADLYDEVSEPAVSLLKESKHVNRTLDRFATSLAAFLARNAS